MDDKTTLFTRAWNRLWAEQVEKTGFGGSLREPIELRDTPAYPLARTVEMPPGHGYETGSLSFRLTDLALHGVSRLDPERCALQEEGERIHLELAFPELVLRGRCLVEAKPDPVVDLDTAGDLMDLPSPEAARLAEEKESWLDQARDEREKLSNTPNGEKLLRLYYEHNETYNEVFKNPALVTNWRADGATREMAGDTSAALAKNSVVNSSRKTYGKGLTYNGNAFVQQLNVASACVYSDPDFDPEKGPSLDSKYWAAAKASLVFGKGIGATTANTKSSVQEMQPSEIYSAVERQETGLPDVTDKEIMAVVGVGESQNSFSSDAETTADLSWIEIDEEDRTRLRNLFEATMRQRAAEAAVTAESLFEGACEARIHRVEANVELAVEESPEGRRARALSIELVLDDLGLDLSMSDWPGAAGEIARQRLAGMGFVDGLLARTVHARLERQLLAAAERACGAVLHEA